MPSKSYISRKMEICFDEFANISPYDEHNSFNKGPNFGCPHRSQVENHAIRSSGWHGFTHPTLAKPAPQEFESKCSWLAERKLVFSGEGFSGCMWVSSLEVQTYTVYIMVHVGFEFRSSNVYCIYQ